MFSIWLKSFDTPFHLMPADQPGASKPVGSKLASNVNPARLTPAASLANDLGGYFATKTTGTNAMTGVKVPSGFRGLVCLLPSDGANGVTGGTYASDGVLDSVPFKRAWTATANSAVLFFCDGDFLYDVKGNT